VADDRDQAPREGALLVDDDESRERKAKRSRDDDEALADEAANVLEDLLDIMDIDADVHIREDGDRIVLDVRGPEAGRAIGKKGQTLDALQFLLNRIVNRDADEQRHIIVDSGDYRERHDKSLANLAEREAKRAIQSGRTITLQPMSARDRRVIHLSLAKFEGVTTESSGEGMRRRIQIIPTGAPRRSRR
jgi:spoIIIJ-associated protein